MSTTPQNEHVVIFDVDGTLIDRQGGALPNIVDRAALDPAGAKELAALRARFTPLAYLGQLSHADDMFWITETFRIYAEYGLTRSGWQAALDGVVLREGVVETFAWLADKGIPTAAASHGCADFIEYALARHGIRIGAIYSGRLRHEGDRVIGADPATFVLPAHKGERSRHFADIHGVPYERIIAVGDSAGDRFMGHLKEHRIGISETEESAEALRQLDVMGEIHVSQTFHPILAALKRRIDPS